MPTPFKLEYDQRTADRRINPEAEQASTVAALDRLSSDLELANQQGPALQRSIPPVQGVYIWGSVGRGKSMLMNLFFDQAPEPLKRRLHFHAFMAEIHAAMQPSRSEADGEAVGSSDPIAAAAKTMLKRARLLCLDELEVVDIADAMILGRLFDRLFEQGLVLVATSNEDPDHLYDKGPNRELFEPFVERLKMHVQVVQVGGEHDHRSDGHEAASTYLFPMTKENRLRFDRLWNEALGADRETPSSIRVHGRDLEMSRTCGHHVRMTFDEVCKRPLSADDHLAIAQHFQDVFLEGVPTIQIDHLDEGRRLVTLVDALYEAHAHLVVFAEAGPGEIFEDTSSDDHRRTVSRLNEMRDANWTRPRLFSSADTA
jgi:cell division protein ZapE